MQREEEKSHCKLTRTSEKIITTHLKQGPAKKSRLNPVRGSSGKDDSVTSMSIPLPSCKSARISESNESLFIKSSKLSGLDNEKNFCTTKNSTKQKTEI